MTSIIKINIAKQVLREQLEDQELTDADKTALEHVMALLEI